MDPAARRDTPASGMPAGRKLPAVTENRNYPQPVKHLKPTALSHPMGNFLTSADPDVELADGR